MTARRTRAGAVRTSRNGRASGLVRMDPRTLKTSGENANIYRPFRVTDDDDAQLVASMKREGFRDAEPIILSGDGFILSGHRRREAAISAGLALVPVIVRADKRRDAMPHDDFVALLASYNTGQRVKDRREALSERMASIDPTAAHVELRDRIRTAAAVKVQAMKLPAVARRRATISDQKRPMLQAAVEIIERLRPFWPVSLRHVHYNMLNAPPPRNAGDRRKLYRNDRASYQDLSDLLTRARLVGAVPMEAIGDETRPVSSWPHWRTVDGFIDDQLRDLFAFYRRDRLQSQDAHIEVIAEKLTVQGILEGVVYEYGVPLTIGRGWGSLPTKRDVLKRYRDSGKRNLVLLLMADLDPDGDGLAIDYPIALRDDFGLADDEMRAVRVAVLPEHVERFGLPQSADAADKESSRLRAFRERHGTTACFELEAVEPTILQKLLRAAIEAELDREAFDAEVLEEQNDARLLEAVKRDVLEGVKGT